jgi:hypothetical protein
MPRNWIQGAVHPNKKGTFTAYAKKKGGMVKGIQAGLKSHNKTTRARAQFAKNMRAIAARH